MIGIHVRDLHSQHTSGISGLMAAVIVVCVGIAIAILISFWMSGVVTLSGVGGSPERLEIMGDLNVRGSEFKVIVVNKGGTVSVVESIYVDGKYEATVIDAYVYGKSFEKRIYDLGNGKLGALILPSEKVIISCLLKNTKLKPGSDHEIKLVTAKGSEFRRPVRAAWSPIRLDVKAYDLGIKNPISGNKLLLVTINYYNAYTQPATQIKASVISLSKVTQELGSWTSPNTMEPIEPGSEANIMFTIQLSGSASGTLVVKVDIVYKDGSTDESAAFVTYGKNIMAYVISIDQIPGHWVDKSKVTLYVQKILSNYHIINNLKELYEFINDPASYSKKYGLPVNNIIVINAHGELVPLASPLDDVNHYYVYDNGTPVKVNGHYTWYRKIREDIMNYGWIWVAIDGYAFYYTDTINVSGSLVKSTTGTQGGKDIFDVDFNVQGFEPSNSTSVPTDYVRDAANLLGDDTLYRSSAPSNRTASRALSSLVRMVFYNFTDDPDYPYASALYSLGKGYVLINGWTYDSAPVWGSKEEADDYIAKSAVYLAVYSYIKMFIASSTS